jgi:hypothetical protein
MNNSNKWVHIIGNGLFAIICIAGHYILNYLGKPDTLDILLYGGGLATGFCIAWIVQLEKKDISDSLWKSSSWRKKF